MACTSTTTLCQQETLRKGVWGFSPSHKLCSLTRILAQSLQVCSASNVQYSHVPAHHGDPWNELADTLANSCRKGQLSPSRAPDFDWRPWMEGNYVIAAEHLHLSLQALQGRQDLPAGCGGELIFRNYDSAPPSEFALWPLDLQEECNGQRGGGVETVQLKCCSYNVRALQDPKTGQPIGTAEYLRAQFTQLYSTTSVPCKKPEPRAQLRLSQLTTSGLLLQEKEDKKAQSSGLARQPGLATMNHVHFIILRFCTRNQQSSQ